MKFRFYNVEMLRCPECNGTFNYYEGVSPKGRRAEYVIKLGLELREQDDEV